jgi:hypothetical protein
MKPFAVFPISASRATYKGQKVMSQLKALRSNEVKHRMCLEARNIVDNIYNKFKIAGFISKSDYQVLLNAFLTYVLKDRVDEVK